jgi:hypothetical protein
LDRESREKRKPLKDGRLFALSPKAEAEAVFTCGTYKYAIFVVVEGHLNT